MREKSDDAFLEQLSAALIASPDGLRLPNEVMDDLRMKIASRDTHARSSLALSLLAFADFSRRNDAPLLASQVISLVQSVMKSLSPRAPVPRDPSLGWQRFTAASDTHFVARKARSQRRSRLHGSAFLGRSFVL